MSEIKEDGGIDERAAWNIKNEKGGRARASTKKPHRYFDRRQHVDVCFDSFLIYVHVLFYTARNRFEII